LTLLKYFILLILLIFINESSFALPDSTTTKIDTNYTQLPRPRPFDWITNLPGDWWKWTKQTFTVKQLPIIGGLAAITAMTIITDYETWQATKKPYDENNTFRQINDVTSYLGDGKVQFGISLAFLAYGFAFNNNRAIRTASQTVEVILATGGIVQLLKHTTGRQSPNRATTTTGRWDFFPNQVEYMKHTPAYDAFPSGHIATALATLQVIIENYPEQKWIQYVGYPIIGSIAVGLVATSIHWWSDIPLGMAIGYSFGMLVSHPEPEKNESQGYLGMQPSVNFSVLGNGSPAVGLSLKW
jgi:hypothetical protein